METTLTNISQALFESSQDAILIVSSDQGTVLDANPVASSLFGLDSHSLSQKQVVDLLRPSAEPASSEESSSWKRMHVLRNGSPQIEARVKQMPLTIDEEPKEILIVRPVDVTRDERFLTTQTRILEQLWPRLQASPSDDAFQLRPQV